MEHFTRLARISFIAFSASLASCGGGAQQPDGAITANMAFVADYSIQYDGTYPEYLRVGPVPPRLTLAKKGVAKVEFLLFGHDMQTLTAPNSAPQVPPELRYVFRVPDDFVPGIYECTGQFLSEVRVTDTEGQVLSQLFELCPRTYLKLPPVYSTP